MRASKLVSFSFLALAAIATSIVACSSSTSGNPAACDSICAITQECGGSSCLVACLETQTTCTTKGHPEAFDSFASCSPFVTCGPSGGFQVVGCTTQSIGLVLCGPGLFGSSGGSSFPPPGGDGGIVFQDGGQDVTIFVDGNVPEDAGGDDSGGNDSGEDGGCGICQSSCTNSCGESCSGGECSCQPNGSCDTSCVDNCGNSCTGGSCESSCVPDGTCDTYCQDNCGNSCSGGSCAPSCVPNGTCDTYCQDNCGNSCSGGSCSADAGF